MLEGGVVHFEFDEQHASSLHSRESVRLMVASSRNCAYWLRVVLSRLRAFMNISDQMTLPISDTDPVWHHVGTCIHTQISQFVNGIIDAVGAC